ncbi:hypothetical protein MKW92_007393 [Papaver armeniacum]|nr:hypothetical protein MKW92_007393 [Papaver armeniacum]
MYNLGAAKIQMALVQESSKDVSMFTSKEVDEMSESETSVSECLWVNCTNEALYFWYSPLFVHMASGDLDDKEFYQYVANYAQLLNDFSEVYKLPADQCVDDSGKAAFLLSSYNVKQEPERHNSFVETSYLHAEVLLDKLCNSLAQEEIEDVERLCRQAMRLELDLFYSRKSEQIQIIPIYVKLDPKERLLLFADQQLQGEELRNKDRDGHCNTFWILRHF